MSSVPKSFCQIKSDEILKATKNIEASCIIGRGRFGEVFKSNITRGSDSVTVAIKRLNTQVRVGLNEFWTEVNMLSTIRHPNIVSLIGCCEHEDEKILLVVYEYMPNGTLYDHLHKYHTPLSWNLRLKICIDAARGLSYLHKGTLIGIHGCVNSSNILFHENWAPKLSNPLLKNNQLSTSITGNVGYLDPSYYFVPGRMSRNSDVYAFGVLMIEVLCRKLVLGEHFYEEGIGLVTWAKRFIKEADLKHIIDPEIKDEIAKQSLNKFMTIAYECLQEHQKSRPTMAKVVADLEAVLASQERFNGSKPQSFWQLESSSVSMFSSSPKHFPQSCRSIEYHEIVKATQDFNKSQLIEDGSFGEVYKGNITCGSNSVVAAIRYMDPKLNHGEKEFWAEVKMLSELRHSNIVSLIGYCDHEEKKVLVYEYMPNGTLDYHLHKRRSPLSWIQRLKICLNAAHGLSYMHEGTGFGSGIIHGGVSSSNILFHENWAPKLSYRRWLLERDQLSNYDNTCVIDDFGYLDPIYYATGKLGKKSDVYAFGVLLLEVLSRKPVLGENVYEEGMNLVMWAKNFIKEGNLKHITDPDIWDEISPKCLKKYISFAKRCLHEDLTSRPTMAEVVAGLEAVLASQEKVNGSKQQRFRSLLTTGTNLWPHLF